MSEGRRFAPELILRALIDRDVAFVIVGGLAAQFHGSPVLTGDVDICYARDGDNLERLAGALADLAAVRRGMPAGVSAPLDTRALRAGDVFTLTTRHGDLDLLGAPDPGFDYETLRPDSIPAALLGVGVLVANLDDLVAMKRAAGRPKDLLALEHLSALREEIDRRG